MENLIPKYGIKCQKVIYKNYHKWYNVFMKINFNKRNLNIISFFVSLFIFIIIVFTIRLITNQKINQEYSYVMPSTEQSNETSAENRLAIASANIIGANMANENIVSANEQNFNQKNSNEVADLPVVQVTNWQIEIEKLNLGTNIAEGVSKDIIENSVGHYTDSNILNGIIGLKAYNVGESNNYFANLKELQIGDEINYTVNENQSTYKVTSNKIIKCDENLNEADEFTQILNNIKGNDIDSKNTETENDQSKNDILILITYVKDLPNNLRCVVAEKN